MVDSSVANHFDVNLRVCVTEEPENRRSVMSVGGELDADNYEILESKLAQLDGDVVIDLAELTFIDSSGVSTILSGRELAASKGSSVTVVGACGVVARIVKIVGLEGIFMSKGTEPAAL